MRDSGAESAKDMGTAMKQAMAAVDGRADGKRVSGLVRAALQRMRTQIELPNEVAAELAGSQDAVLRALEAHLECKVFLRGNLLTFDGEESETHAGERVVRELSELIARGHQIGPGTIAAVTGALDAHESPARVLEDVVWRHRGLRVAPKTVNQKRYVDSVRDEHDHLRRRPGRAPARRSSRSRWPPRRSRATRSTASSSRAPPSRPASASASCPAT